MELEPFLMERLQSVWERQVAWNLAESGVHPLRIEELLQTPEERDALLRQDLGYPPTNGSLELRAAVAAMYPDATPAHVQITNGGSEANLITTIALVGPGDEVIVMMPNYLQVPGLVRSLGGVVREWPLVREPGTESAPARWGPDLGALAAMITERTRAVFICNPNNPTGARLTGRELDAVCAIAASQGAWVVSDEIYRGAELDGAETPTAWGRYDRVLVTSGLSKAFALPGLRIGWVTGAPATIERLWGVHDYTSIAPGAANDRLARIALEPPRREVLLARTRGIVRTNYTALRRWLDRRAAFLSHVAPEAGAIAFVRYRYPCGSTALVERVRREQSVLLVPGDHFGMDGYIRIGFGGELELLLAALERVGDTFDALAGSSA